MAPTVSNDCTVNPQNAPSPVSNDCTHIIYQSPRTDKRHPFPPPIPRLVTAPTAPDTIPWMPPRRFKGRIRPQPMEMRQAVDADALTDLQRLFFSNALSDGPLDRTPCTNPLSDALSATACFRQNPLLRRAPHRDDGAATRHRRPWG